MKNPPILIEEIQQLVFQNVSLANLMHGYCIATAKLNDEMEYLIQGFEVMLQNQKKLQDMLDNLTTM